MSKLSWNDFLRPNFKTEFYLRNTRNFNYDTKYSYEEFLDNPKTYDMVFADTYDYNEIDDDISIDVIPLINRIKPDYKLKINLEQPFDDQMVDTDYNFEEFDENSEEDY